jgi:hypothetical protein
LIPSRNFLLYMDAHWYVKSEGIRLEKVLLLADLKNNCSLEGFLILFANSDSWTRVDFVYCVESLFGNKKTR